MLATSDTQLQERLLGDREHAARTGCAVVKQVRAGFNLVSYGQEDQIRHQADSVAGRPVFTGLFVVFLVELADEFLENRAHRMVVESSGAQVYIRVEEFVD